MKNIFWLVEKLNGCEKNIVGNEIKTDKTFDVLLKIDIKRGAMTSIEINETKKSYAQKDTDNASLLSNCDKSLGMIKSTLP